MLHRITILALMVCVAVPALAAEAAVDLAASAQQLGADNFSASLKLTGAIPADKNPRDLSLTGHWFGGKASGGFGQAGSWNKARHEAVLTAAGIDGDTITGTFAVTLKPDRWVPADKQPIPMTVSFTGTVTYLNADGAIAPYSEGYWAHPQLRAGVLATVSGTFTATCDKLGPSQGDFSGTLKLPKGANKWTLGQWDGSGIRMGFDLGSKRVNWTKMGHSRLDFTEARDLSKHQGLSVTVSTDAPRADAAVSVWLRESDGSWYYYSDAVPLTGASQTVELLFADFEEAEWVSPDGGTTFMDEDFQLDVSAIDAMAIGVVNPLGVGPVQYRVDAIDLLTAAATPTTVQVAVSGKTLAVNGHRYIPAGLFGGYAPDLPQKYRPGCQRHLRTLPSGGASNPWGAIFYGSGSVKDGIALAKAWQEGDAIGQAILAMCDDKTRKSVANAAVEPKKKRDKKRWPGNAKKAIAKALNIALNKDDLADTAALAAAKNEIATAKATEAGSVKRKAANRKLLDAVLGDAVGHMVGAMPSESFIIDCQGDRTQAASYLQRDDWEQYLTSCAVQYAKQSAAYDYRAHTEFWNEPYLDWAKGRNYNTKFFREDLAKEGGPVTVKREDGGEEEVIPHFVWYKKGDKWAVKDGSRFTYWSGRGHGWIYDRMFAVYGKAVKETDPKVPVIAGWGMKWHEDHWAAWDMLFKPTIDQGIEWIDGIHEHHYMGDTTDIGGSYETLVAYTTGTHGKWVYGYNTETTDLLDVPAVGVNTTPEKVAGNKGYRVGTYNLRDILYLCAQVPDKAKARTVIHYDHTKVGTDMCFDTLKDLRGQLIAGTSSDSKVWVAASVDGTDPYSMPPDGKLALVVAVWNDHRVPQEVAIDLTAPAGTTFAGGMISKPWFDKVTRIVDLKPVEAKASGTSYKATLTIPERAVWKISIPLTGKLADTIDIQRSQFFAKEILADVKPGSPVTLPVAVDAAKLGSATAARLRLVVEDVAIGEGTVSLNGAALAIPKAVCRDNGNLIVEIPVGVDQVKPGNELIFSVNDGPYQGYKLPCASIVLDHP